MTKTYVTFGNDHSGSMGKLANAALKDYNANIAAVKDAATREMQDTIVSVIAFATNVKRDIVVSNPHVLNPKTRWEAGGVTSLWDAVGDAVALMKSLPDYDSKDVSFLVFITTDGEEYGSRTYNAASIRELITELSKDGRWTFVFRVPEGNRHMVENIGVPAGNIQEWGITEAGMRKSTVATAAAIDTFYGARSAGARGSNTFYANAGAVNLAALTEIPKKKISEYIVDDYHNGKQIQEFILSKRMKFLKGAAFFQLTKTEAKLGYEKVILLRDKDTGKYFGGPEVRKMLGLPTDQNARLHPGDHGQFDIFIQSTSLNRKLIAGTGLMYWEEMGVAFTQADHDKIAPKAVAPVATPAVLKMAEVKPTNKPTPSPLKPVPVQSVDGVRVKFFDKRSDARKAGSVKDLYNYSASKVVGNGQARWFVYA